MAVGKGLTPMTPMEPINTDKTTEEDSTPVDTAVVLIPMWLAFSQILSLSTRLGGY
jgi:hypothetical protein